MSKVRSGVVLVVLLLLATPVLASDQFVAPSPTAFMADLWSEVVEIVEQIFGNANSPDELGPMIYPNGVETEPDDELGPTPDPNG